MAPFIGAIVQITKDFSSHVNSNTAGGGGDADADVNAGRTDDSSDNASALTFN